MPFVVKTVFLCVLCELCGEKKLCSFVCFVDDNARNGFKLLFNGYTKCRSRLSKMSVDGVQNVKNVTGDW